MKCCSFYLYASLSFLERCVLTWAFSDNLAVCVGSTKANLSLHLYTHAAAASWDHCLSRVPLGPFSLSSSPFPYFSDQRRSRKREREKTKSLSLCVCVSASSRKGGRGSSGGILRGGLTSRRRRRESPLLKREEEKEEEFALLEEEKRSEREGTDEIAEGIRKL